MLNFREGWFSFVSILLANIYIFEGLILINLKNLKKYWNQGVTGLRITLSGFLDTVIIWSSYGTNFFCHMSISSQEMLDYRHVCSQKPNFLCEIGTLDGH